jgi:hypothetical protein
MSLDPLSVGWNSGITCSRNSSLKVKADSSEVHARRWLPYIKQVNLIDSRSFTVCVS